jgi:hypothetical protein
LPNGPGCFDAADTDHRPPTTATAGKNLGLETRHWRIRITEHAARDVRGCATDSKT